MRRWLGGAVLVGGLVGLCVFGYLMLAVPVGPGMAGAVTGDAENGRYLLQVSGCITCHSDPKGGGAELAGGAAIKTPFGRFYAPNITLHEDDGIGGWTLDDFAVALRDGRAPDGSPYYPAFPYPSFTKLTDQDVADLWAALEAAPPAGGRAPDHELGFPFNQRWLMRPWMTLFFEPGRFQPDPAENDIWNRGAYLVEAPGHCGACHTPRNALGAPDTGRPLAGGVGPDNEKVPGIDTASLEADGWSKGDIEAALSYGMKPDGDFIGGSMGEVVEGGTGKMTEEDRAAIASYLMSGKH